MLINLRNALMAGRRLPYDAEVEWLERRSSYTGYVRIPTGIYSTINTVIKAKIQCISLSSGEGPVFGDRWAGQAMFLEYTKSTLKWHMTSSGSFSTSVNNSVPNTIEASNGKLVVDGVTKTNSALSQITSAEIVLLGFGNDYRGDAVVRIYWVQIEQNGVLVRDYIPVRKGTVGYLYDRVSGKLFGNAGTGDFVLGPDVVPVEWIQTDGSAYIDTGLEMADGHEVRAEHYFKRATTRQLMGSNASRQYYGVSADGYVEFGLLGTNKSTVSVDEAKKYLISYEASGGNNTGSIYEGNTLLWSSSGAYYGFSNSFKIFRLSTNPGLPFVAGNKIASFKHIASGETIQSLLSVRVGTEGAMMDVLTRRIYRNAGTGAFTYGNDLKYPIPSE
jgi:hypothetical protein